jgi:hypothetical protein
MNAEDLSAENLRNLREAFCGGAGTRPACLRKNILKVMFDFLPDSSELTIDH